MGFGVEMPRIVGRGEVDSNMLFLNDYLCSACILCMGFGTSVAGYICSTNQCVVS